MRRATWLVLVGVIGIGCARKEEAPVPNVALEQDGPRFKISLNDQQPPTFVLPYGKMWDPKRPEKPDPATAVNTFLAQQYFTEHQTEFLAPATVGSFVSLAQGGPHGVVVPAALASAYPELAKKFESKKGITLTAADLGDSAVLDISSQGGSLWTRVLVFRVKDGTDDDLRVRFGEYLTRLESAVKGTGATITAYQRGGVRITGPLSDIRYEVPGQTGFVRSVVVRKFDDADAEFAAMMIDNAKGNDAEVFRLSMPAGRGPYLVVALRNERR